MPTFSYRALTQVGEVVSGSLVAASAREAQIRMEYLKLIPIEAPSEKREARPASSQFFSFVSSPRPEDVTIFSGDLALLLRTGARIDEALELLASDPDLGRMRKTVSAMTSAVLSGESFGEAVSKHPAVFPPMYAALVRVGEASGTLVGILEALNAERLRAEALRRRLTDTLRYPAFLLLAASGVLLFFLTFVLPQFAGVFKDFNAKLDPVLVTFLALSAFLRGNTQGILIGLLCLILVVWLLARRPTVRAFLADAAARLPLVRPVMSYRRTSLFCRNLGLLLTSGVTLTVSLRILADMMDGGASASRWSRIVDRVRHGGKLSDALSAEKALPSMAVRTMRLGEDSGQLPMLSGRIADFYEAKLQRSLDRIVAVAGPAAIIVISLVVGGLIVSVMTALLSVNQVIG